MAVAMVPLAAEAAATTTKSEACLSLHTTEHFSTPEKSRYYQSAAQGPGATQPTPYRSLGTLEEESAPYESGGV